MEKKVQRIDDFRCHDELLVQVLPGREAEAAEMALALNQEGRCDGVFVSGKEVVEWSFLEKVRTLDRFLFSNVDKSFKSVDTGILKNALMLGVADIKVDLDLRSFNRIEHLIYHWNSFPAGLHALHSLRKVRFFGVTGSDEGEGIELPSGVRICDFVRYARSVVDLGHQVATLDALMISRARDVSSIPRIESVKKLDISFVGRDHFDYDSIPEDVEELMIDSCAEISSWRFLEGKNGLRRLFIDRTKLPAPDARAMQTICAIPDVHIPSLRMTRSC
ncbi:hypothetical protein [Pseudoxanthomonas sp. PXM02]|uniref:hypothetical protein n=1 Tax=Pseudoxanthomonas sp. PXM02 TaxID=2769294 RepID=UPI0017815CB6|nr:hypothetical protein [Pseudoxanthomonas sp. PXM02]MBD9480699.1 hypothetical protein [Pseudoxanthomonas sp. PXM02]